MKAGTPWTVLNPQKCAWDGSLGESGDLQFMSGVCPAYTGFTGVSKGKGSITRKLQTQGY